MEERQLDSKKRYFYAFVIGTIVFLIVFGITYFLSYLEFQRISNLQSNSAYRIFEDKLDFSIFEKDMCPETSFKEVTQDLNFQGRIIDDLEKKLGKSDQSVLSRKKFYTLVELEHFEFVKTLNQECKLGMNTILFFYSNEKGDLKNSEDVGKLLGAVYTKNQNNLIIYSFDINLNSDLIKKLKEKYGIKESTTVIINEQYVVINPDNINQIEKYLSEE